MSQPKILRGTYFSLMMGNGAGPEVFSALCGVTTRNFTHQANTSDSFVRDCTLPENVPVRRAIVTGEQWDLTGEGVLNREDLERIEAAVGKTKNYRFLFTEPADDEVFQGYYAGPAILTNLAITGGDDAFATVSLSFVSDGAWAFTEVTPS